jgi:hypothetical protein
MSDAETRVFAGRLLLCAGLLMRRRRQRLPSEAVATRRGAQLLAAFLAAGGPLAVLVPRLLRGPVRVVGPPSATGRVLLAVHLAAVSGAEELLWRAPLCTTPRPLRLSRAVVHAVVFTAAHVRRDGRGTVAVHTALAATWTASALVARRIRWAFLAHLCYDLAAVLIQPAAHDTERTSL